MAIDKIQSESINLADTFAFTGTVTGAGGVNTPAFFVTRNSTQGFNEATNTKVEFNNEIYDTDNTFDSSTNYRWTPAVAGKYFMSAMADINVGGSNAFYVKIEIYKNGTKIARVARQTTDYYFPANTLQHIAVSTYDLADDNDYYEVYVNANNVSGNNDCNVGTNSSSMVYACHFGGYKIIT
jgi:hypothetical protein